MTVSTLTKRTVTSDVKGVPECEIHRDRDDDGGPVKIHIGMSYCSFTEEQAVELLVVIKESLVELREIRKSEEAAVA